MLSKLPRVTTNVALSALPRPWEAVGANSHLPAPIALLYAVARSALLLTMDSAHFRQAGAAYEVEWPKRGSCLLPDGRCKKSGRVHGCRLLTHGINSNNTVAAEKKLA